jgi:hypothetical protein
MHEMGLAQAILDTARQLAGERPIRRVVVSAGEAQAVNADSLRFSFDVVAATLNGTDVTLEVRSVPGDRLLVDEVEVGGATPEVLRRPDADVVEAPHEHSHETGDAPVHPAWL